MKSTATVPRTILRRKYVLTTWCYHKYTVYAVTRSETSTTGGIVYFNTLATELVQVKKRSMLMKCRHMFKNSLHLYIIDLEENVTTYVIF